MREDIRFAMFGLASVYDKSITVELSAIWENILGELTEEELAKAVKAYVRDPKNRFFPKPGEIYGLARPQENKEEKASIIADDIFASVRLYGTDTIGSQKARTKMGEEGWNYVQRQGGWDTFVKSVASDDDVPIMKAQARKSLMGWIQRERNDIQPEKGEKLVTLESLGLTMKSIGPSLSDPNDEDHR